MTGRDAGRRAETAAVQYLEQKGYAVLMRNVHCGRAEFDVVAMDGPMLVFVEVKARSSIRYGWPESFVTEQKQQLLMKGAERFISESCFFGEARFDVVSIVLNSNNVNRKSVIRHFPDAFYG